MVKLLINGFLALLILILLNSLLSFSNFMLLFFLLLHNLLLRLLAYSIRTNNLWNIFLFRLLWLFKRWIFRIMTLLRRCLNINSLILIKFLWSLRNNLSCYFLGTCLFFLSVYVRINLRKLSFLLLNSCPWARLHMNLAIKRVVAFRLLVVTPWFLIKSILSFSLLIKSISKMFFVVF